MWPCAGNALLSKVQKGNQMVEIVDQITFLKEIEKALANPNNMGAILFALKVRIAKLESEIKEFEEYNENN